MVTIESFFIPDRKLIKGMIEKKVCKVVNKEQMMGLANSITAQNLFKLFL